MDDIRIARTDDEMLACWDAIFSLRPHLVKNQFLPQVKRMMDEGFRMAFIEHDQKAVCVAGYRFEEMLHRGKSMYIDDLVTLPEYRSRKFGNRMLDWLFARALEKGCRQVHLDSGVQRFDAHRFYLNKGFRITSHHFSIELPGGPIPI